MAQVCPQCAGSGKTTVLINEQLTTPNGVTFTDKTQEPEQVCNFCQGVKYFTGMMA